MDTVLITGINGFIGKHAACHFLTRGLRVVGIDLHAQASGPWSEYVPMTLPSADLVPKFREWHPSVCIHCAGPSSVGNSIQDPAGDFQGSVAATCSLLDAIRSEVPACRVIYLSSAAVYGNPVSLPIDEKAPVQPISPYGFHKQMCERLCLEFHQVFSLRTAVLRIFSAYGPGLHRQVIADLSRKLLSSDNSKPIELYGTGSETRDFIQVDDIIAGVEAILAGASFQGEIYNLASGQSSTIARVVEVLRKRLDPAREIRFTGESRTGDPLYWSANIDKLRSLGFVPRVSLENGLSQYAEWIKNSV
jgi:UDP-glucose 4-epimerase